MVEVLLPTIDAAGKQNVQVRCFQEVYLQPHRDRPPESYGGLTEQR
jgi:hypothetical protein